LGDVAALATYDMIGFLPWPKTKDQTMTLDLKTIEAACNTKQKQFMGAATLPQELNINVS